MTTLDTITTSAGATITQVVFPQPESEEDRWYDGMGLYFLVAIIAAIIALLTS